MEKTHEGGAMPESQPKSDAEERKQAVIRKLRRQIAVLEWLQDEFRRLRAEGDEQHSEKADAGA